MQLALYKGTSFVSKCIRFVTRSEYSHAAIILRSGRVIEAWQPTVRIVADLSEQHTPGTVVDVFDFADPLTIEEEMRATQFLTGEVGVPYDYKSVLRFVTRRPGNLDDHWFCSELAFAAAEVAGRRLFHWTEAWQVPPDWLPRSPLLRWSYQTRTE